MEAVNKENQMNNTDWRFIPDRKPWNSHTLASKSRMKNELTFRRSLFQGSTYAHMIRKFPCFWVSEFYQSTVLLYGFPWTTSGAEKGELRRIMMFFSEDLGIRESRRMYVSTCFLSANLLTAQNLLTATTLCHFYWPWAVAKYSYMSLVVQKNVLCSENRTINSIQSVRFSYHTRLQVTVNDVIFV